MKYAALVEVYEQLDATTKRLEKTDILAALLRRTPADDTEETVLLLEGRVYPAWDEREIGVAKQLMAKAISRATGTEPSRVEREWKKTGDLGKVAENLARGKSQRTLAAAELTVKKVFSNVRKLAEIEGQGSVDRKLQLIAELLTSASPAEARYIARTILQQLRIGIGAGTMRDAIALAFFGKETEGKKEITAAVQEAYDLSNDFAVVAAAARKGKQALERIELHIGSPVKVMLALKADTIEEALKSTGTPAEVEYKFDGFRVQVHKEGKNVTIFTRRLDNVTEQFPEIVTYAQQYVKAKSCILDAEAVGFDPKSLRYRPFQEISQRIRRKYDIERLARELPVEVNVFDILSLNGRNLIQEPFRKRRHLVEEIVAVHQRRMLPAKKLVTSDVKKIEDFFREAKKAGNEGLMLKNLDAPYKPGARVGYMIKYKKTLENLDLVIVAAEWGEGKRAKWLSSYTVACRKGEKFAEVGKVSTGLKEKPEEGLSYDEMTQLLRPIIIKEEGKVAVVKPKIVIEVAYEELQQSPQYSSGFAMRFPRVARLRDDKGPHDAATVKEVEKIYQSQRFMKKR